MSEGVKASQEPRSCERHGEYLATISVYDGVADEDQRIAIASPCPECRLEKEAARRGQEEENHRRKVASIKASSGVPARYARASFGEYHCETKPQELAHAIVAAYADSWPRQSASGKSLLLIGGPGTGKTHLATATVNALAERLERSLYGTAADLVSSIKRHYGRRGGEEIITKAIADLVDVPLLVIDELDVGLTDHDLTLLFRVIDGRYSHLQPMILISNRPVDHLGELLGHRVLDRLRECAVTVAFTWPSYRSRRAA